MNGSIACVIFILRQGDGLQQIMNVCQLLNANIGGFHEKLLIMIIDGTIHFGIDPITMSDEFNQRGITLAVVAHATFDFKIWDFYCELARNTGGEYILLADASRFLAHVIASVIFEEETLRQAFLHMRKEDLSVPVNNTDIVGEANGTPNGVGDLNFYH